MSSEGTEQDDDYPSSHRSVGLEILERLRAGESRAFSELFENYSQQLIRVASVNIHPALLKRFDGEDIVQSVFRSFFRRHEDGHFQFEHSQQLWQLLVTLTLFKTRSQSRKHTAGKRDVKADGGQFDLAEMVQNQPSPEDAMALWEEIDLVIEGLPERTGEIISKRLEGRSRVEIAQQMNLSRQTIHRVLHLVKERLEARFATLDTN